MKKTGLLIIAMAFCLVGCASNKTDHGKVDDKLPEWIMEEPKSNDGIYASGVGKMADLVTSKKMAQADAMNNLARKVNTLVKDVTQTMISSSETHSIKGFEENALQTAEASLRGYEQKNYYVAKDGTVYVLLFLPYQTQVDQLNKVAEEYSIPAEYLMSQAKMQEAYDRLFK